VSDLSLAQEKARSHSLRHADKHLLALSKHAINGLGEFLVIVARGARHPVSVCQVGEDKRFSQVTALPVSVLAWTALSQRSWGVKTQQGRIGYQAGKNVVHRR